MFHSSSERKDRGKGDSDRGYVVDENNLPFLTPDAGTVELSPDHAELLRYTVDALRRHFNPLFSSQFFQSVAPEQGYRFQQFYYEMDQDFQRGRCDKPLFLSPSYGGVVINGPALIRHVEHNWLSSWIEIRDKGLEETINRYAKNRVEFALHEYGHLASVNGTIRCREDNRSESEEKRDELCRAIRLLPESGDLLRVFKEALSDIRAEVFRRDLKLSDPLKIRSPEIFAADAIEDRVLPGGPLRPRILNPDGIIRMSSWCPVCIGSGPPELRDTVKAEVAAYCRRYAPGYLPFAEGVQDYFELYMNTRYFDQDSFEAIGTTPN